MSKFYDRQITEAEKRAEKKEIEKKKKDKNIDFYYAMAKITYTALVVGVIVAIIQDFDSASWPHIFGIVFGASLTEFWYLYANKKQK